MINEYAMCIRLLNPGRWYNKEYTHRVINI